MAYLATWNITQLPKAMVDILEEDIKGYDKDVDTSKVMGDKEVKSIRNSKNTWITTEHWIGGFLWYYIQKVNKQNFCYDLIDIDGASVQYTHYGPGEYYNWHQDGDIDTAFKPQLQASSGTNLSQDIFTVQGECVRKLSFALQLSDMDEYTGGEVEFMDSSDKPFLAPKQRGTLIIFDSRMKHRVRKVKTGLRKSLVGWVVGPRWK
tara:strand:- start:1676 stop:2293 length:618 start_codon:yes stop_codon:yes gene_type:complete